MFLMLRNHNLKNDTVNLSSRVELFLVDMIKKKIMTIHLELSSS